VIHLQYLIGIDVGTSGTKTVLFDSSGKTVASTTVEYPLYQPQPGWAEQDPADWWKAVCDSVKQVISKSGVDKHDVKGIGLSGQMHGLVLLDANDNVLRNAIIWCDQRTQAQCDYITEAVGREKLIEITANPALTGFTASKLLWVRDNEPQIYERISKVLLPKDYIRFMLTGEYATEVSDASGMQLMNIRERGWSGEILSKLQIDKNWLGKMYESFEITGTVSPRAAELTGLAVGTPVAAGGGDQAAGAVGNGIVRSGAVSSTIGSSGVVFAFTDKAAIDPKGRVHTFCHAVPGKWHVMGVTQGAGLSLKWVRDALCGEEVEAAAQMETDPYVLMDEMAEKIGVGSDGLLYLPYMMGERTPHLDPYAKGVFFGLTPSHTKAHIIRSVMEGVTFSLLDCLGVIREMGIPTGEIRVSGGGGKSPLWRQMQADVFENDVMTVNSDQGPALGAALLAAVGTGLYKSVEEACENCVAVKDTTKANPTAYTRYRDYYGLYGKLYRSLKDDFRELARIM